VSSAEIQEGHTSTLYHLYIWFFFRYEINSIEIELIKRKNPQKDMELTVIFNSSALPSLRKRGREIV
jgi:hypothetical protein